MKSTRSIRWEVKSWEELVRAAAEPDVKAIFGQVYTEKGSLDIEGKEVRLVLYTDGTEVNLQNCKGNITLCGISRDIHISNFHGCIALSGEYHQGLRLRDVSGEVLVNGCMVGSSSLDYCKISLSMHYGILSNGYFNDCRFSKLKLSEGSVLSATTIRRCIVKDIEAGTKNFNHCVYSTQPYEKARKYSKTSKLLSKYIGYVPEGDLIGYKKLRFGNIATLRIPADVRRSCAGGNKLRAASAVVLSIENADGEPIEYSFSMFDMLFKYTVGATVKPLSKFNQDWTKECTSGIHFFLTKEEALNY